jgi:hypothetical protein
MKTFCRGESDVDPQRGTILVGREFQLRVSLCHIEDLVGLGDRPNYGCKDRKPFRENVKQVMHNYMTFLP